MKITVEIIHKQLLDLVWMWLPVLQKLTNHTFLEINSSLSENSHLTAESRENSIYAQQAFGVAMLVSLMHNAIRYKIVYRIKLD